MKAKLVLSLVLTTFVTQADTNIFPALTIGDKTYKNARISTVIGNEAVVLFDGGGKRIPLADLPAEIQSKYQPAAVDPAVAEKAEQRKQALAEQQAALARAAAWRGEPKRISIIQPLSYGYRVRIESDGVRDISISKLPQTYSKLFADIIRLDKQIASYSTDVKERMRLAKLAKANAASYVSGDAAYVAAETAKTERANKMMSDAQAMEDELTEMKEKRSQLLQQLQNNSSLMASQTATKYGSMEIWEYVGPAIDTEKLTKKSE